METYGDEQHKKTGEKSVFNSKHHDPTAQPWILIGYIFTKSQVLKLKVLKPCLLPGTSHGIVWKYHSKGLIDDMDHQAWIRSFYNDLMQREGSRRD